MPFRLSGSKRFLGVELTNQCLKATGILCFEILAMYEESHLKKNMSSEGLPEELEQITPENPSINKGPNGLLKSKKRR